MKGLLRRGRIAACLAGIALALMPVPALADNAAPPLVFANGNGLTVVPGSVHQLDARLWSLSFTTSALPQPTNLRILMPSGYTRGTRYPVLWLFSGAGGGAADWTTNGGAEAATAGLRLIVVMPDTTLNGEFNGFCNDWVSGMRHWETYQLAQLLPWTDANLPTIPNRAARAIAGASGGGLCATSIAARHPDLFASTTSFSGMDDIYDNPQTRLLTYAIVSEFAVQDGYSGDGIYGNVLTDGIGWAAYDPTTLAANLRNTAVHLYTGSGLPGGPLDPPLTSTVSGLGSPAAGGLGSIGGLLPVFEAVPAEQTELFHQRLDQLGIASTYVPYGAGSHTWPYFARDLVWALPGIMSDVSNPAPAPTSITYTSADTQYSVYGWNVAMNRSVQEFSTLLQATDRGFAVSGSGSALVTTPPHFVHGARYAVTILTQGSVFPTTFQVTADPSGRLQINVPLGPSNSNQGDTAAALLLSQTYQSSVTITRS
jgi:S-formylglutathione hydrolase FrmB